MYRHLRARLRLIKRKVRRFVFHTILHADDPPHRLALGLAIGIFITFTPTVGFQMALVVFFAWLLRANKVVGLPIVWISNPATIVPIFYVCYRLGRLFLAQDGVGFQWWAELWNAEGPWWSQAAYYWQRFMEVAAPLWVGSLAVAIVAGYATYYISYYAIYGYRMKRWGQPMPPSTTSEEPASPPAET
jgi:uncharacterized protein (DUF2062 family)